MTLSASPSTLTTVPSPNESWLTRSPDRSEIIGRLPAERTPGRPGVRSAGNRPMISLRSGDRVSHDSFGLGTVVRVEGEADKVMAHVDFGTDTGVKRLLLRYAPLEKL